MQFPPTPNVYFITGNGICYHFYIYLSPLDSFEVAQLFFVLFRFISRPSTTASIYARLIQCLLTPFPKTFTCSNMGACWFRCPGSPPSGELTWKGSLSALLCLHSSRDKLSKAVSLLGGRERRKGEGGSWI